MSVKNILIVAAIALLAYAGLLVLPWWSTLAVAFLLLGILPVKPGRGFLLGATGAVIAWLLPAIIADAGNEHLLSSRMAELFHLPQYWMIIAITAIVGGISGGLGGWAASLLRYRKPVVK